MAQFFVDKMSPIEDIVTLNFEIIDLLEKQRNLSNRHKALIGPTPEASPLVKDNFNNIEWIEQRLNILDEDKKISDEFLEVSGTINKKMNEVRYNMDKILLEDAKARLTGGQSVIDPGMAMYLNMSHEMITNYGKELSSDGVDESEEGTPKSITELKTFLSNFYHYIKSKRASSLNNMMM